MGKKTKKNRKIFTVVCPKCNNGTLFVEAFVWNETRVLLGWDKKADKFHILQDNDTAELTNFIESEFVVKCDEGCSFETPFKTEAALLKAIPSIIGDGFSYWTQEEDDGAAVNIEKTPNVPKILLRVPDSG